MMMKYMNLRVSYDTDLVLIKIMLDTNAFDCICDNNLEELVKQYRNQNDVSFFYTHVQQDEIDKIPDGEKKDCLKRNLENVNF